MMNLANAYIDFPQRTLVPPQEGVAEAQAIGVVC